MTILNLYEVGKRDGRKEVTDELNQRLIEKNEAFNEADKRRVARIQELEDQLRLAKVELEKAHGWVNHLHEKYLSN